MDQQQRNNEPSGSISWAAAVDVGDDVRYHSPTSTDKSSAQLPRSLSAQQQQQQQQQHVVVFEFAYADGQDQEERAADATASVSIATGDTPAELIGPRECASKSQAQQLSQASITRYCCWPLSAAQVSPRGATDTSSSSRARARRARKARSDSLELELDKIKMHEKLLISNQKKLFSDLNQELSLLGRLKPLDQDGDETRVGLDMAAAESNVAAAIECRDLTYQAGLGPLQKTILHGVSLSVPEGSIYGLLGPSGCGKTTMLRCVAGRLSPTTGSIRVFGYEPNEPGSRIPGPAIGYMPQELSVYEDFTIEETLGYFGRINRMRPDVLVARINFLLNFLNLPAKTRAIKTLSGGQKRRVSLAVALIHSPPLLILDEPTVGVDPLLRQVIWRYLVTLARADKITIVITTHYIEEARQANIVGLMRAGRMLAEDRPQSLMAQYRQASLENVF